MTGELIPVVCTGDFYYVKDRNKNFRSYEVEVQLPAEEVDRALWFIKKHLIAEAVQSEYPDYGFTGIRTCFIVTNLTSKAEAVGDTVEDMEDVQEDMFAEVETVVDQDDEFADVEDVVGGTDAL